MRLPKLDIAFVTELAVRVKHLCHCLEQTSLIGLAH